ncbi:MAG: FAD-binding oxidoreductase [Chloroflexota bacterium]
MTELTPAQRTELAALAGTVAFPGDEAYAALAMPWNVAVPAEPAAVVAPTSAEEVARVVAFASRERIPVAVQATGHGADDDLRGAILVVTGRLDEVTVHADERWVRVGAGVVWQTVLEALAPHGLAALAGSSPNVSVVGYTTGGGHGPIARTMGLAADRVRAFDVVTGDGVLRRATPAEEPDLFWGLRGGKGALGIVTAIEFDALPIPTLYAGALWFDGADTGAVLHAWADWCPTLPPEATTSIALFQLPEMPGVPPILAGRLAVAMRFAWTGDPAAGEAVLAPMRALAPRLIDGVGVIPYVALGSIHTDPVDPLPAFETAAPLGAFPGDAVDALLAAAGPGSGSPQIVVEVRQLGGAVMEEPAVPAVFPARSVPFHLFAVGVGAPPVVDAVRAHSTALLKAMEPWTMKGALPNFALGSSAVRMARVFPGDTLVRLSGIARTYDPNGILLGGRGLR